MKNPINRAQRGFVVEYKSSRRRPKEEPKSIWGNTDLRAISRAVADDMEVPLAPVPRENLARIFDPNQIPASDRVTETSPKSLTAPECPDLVQASEAAPEPIVGARPKAIAKRKPLRPKPGGNPVHSKRSTPDKAAHTAASINDLDELLVLELDNRHLKRLLAEQLREENAKLAKMLERFAT